MLELEVTTLFFVFLSAGLFGIVALWMYYDFRDRHAYAAQRRQTVFHCIKCGHLYHSHEGSQESSCPVCHHNNQRLKF